MRGVSFYRRFLTIVLVAVSLLWTGLSVQATDDLKTAVQCSFVVPKEFVPGSERGTFNNANHPMESSTISYSYYDNGKDKVLTNREKIDLEKSKEPLLLDESLNLSKEEYQKTLSEAYSKAYGIDVGYKVSSFNKITIDGYPGFRIDGDYQASGEERIYQTTYLIFSKYRTFTVTYQRAEDDDCQDLFEASAETIHVR